MKLKNLTILTIAALSASSASAALVAHYTMDNNGSGGVSATNTGSGGHTLNSSTGATLTTGKFGGAGVFTTSSQWWSNASAGANLNNFTLSMHINTTSAINWADYVSIGESSVSAANAVFKIEQNGAHGGGSIYTNATPGGGTVTIGGSGTPSLNDGNWHHLAMVSNGSTLELFIDGSSKGSAAFTGSGAINAFQLVGQFGGGRNQNANIDDVSIYDTALSSAQIGWLGSNVAIASPVPEPATFAFLGLTGFALIGRRRRSS